MVILPFPTLGIVGLSLKSLYEPLVATVERLSIFALSVEDKRPFSEVVATPGKSLMSDFL